MNGIEYIIVGDTERYDGCLVCLAGQTRKKAEQILDRMLNNPDHHDLACMKGHTNFRIEEVESKYAWWNDPFLAN